MIAGVGKQGPNGKALPFGKSSRVQVSSCGMVRDWEDLCF